MGGKVNVESVRLEINNLRLVHDVQAKELVEGVLRSVLELPQTNPEKAGARWGDLLRFDFPPSPSYYPSHFSLQALHGGP